MDSIGPAGHPDDRADQRSKEARNATGTELWEVMVRGFVPAGNSPAQPGFILSWIQSESTLESSVVNFDTTWFDLIQLAPLDPIVVLVLPE